MKSLLLSLVFVWQFAYADCIHEVQYTGSKIYELAPKFLAESYIADSSGKFRAYTPLMILEPDNIYTLQWTHKDPRSLVESFEGEGLQGRYTYERLIEFLEQMEQSTLESGHKTSIVGQSVHGRNLYAIYPKNFDPLKKTIVMLGRQHGDESRHNWIIEGFLNYIFETDKNWLNEFQLILYPMVNPDGAVANSRYNANGFDLNRQWNIDPSREVDEVKYIHGHFRAYESVAKNIVLALDMHGAFSDFMYHVSRNFRGLEFYQQQLLFIDTLAQFDPWQAGVKEVSNGQSGMARLVFINSYNFNALTHETDRFAGRSTEEFYNQGTAVAKAIQTIL